jgi:uncharacterized repeat protein (TIGR01451 family)
MCCDVVMYATHVSSTGGAGDAAAAGPALAISLTEGASGRSGRAGEVGPGSRLHYTVAVSNRGDRRLTGVELTQRLPEGATRVGADHGGAIAPNGELVWRKVELPAHGSLRLTSTAALSEVAAGERSAASTVCAFPGGAHSPVVCGSVMNPLTVRSGDPERAALAGDGFNGRSLGGVALALLLAGGAGVFAVRRKRANAASLR